MSTSMVSVADLAVIHRRDQAGAQLFGGELRGHPVADDDDRDQHQQDRQQRDLARCCRAGAAPVPRRPRPCSLTHVSLVAVHAHRGYPDSTAGSHLRHRYAGAANANAPSGPCMCRASHMNGASPSRWRPASAYPVPRSTTTATSTATMPAMAPCSVRQAVDQHTGDRRRRGAGHGPGDHPGRAARNVRGDPGRRGDHIAEPGRGQADPDRGQRGQEHLGAQWLAGEHPVGRERGHPDHNHHGYAQRLGHSRPARRAGRAARARRRRSRRAMTYPRGASEAAVG